ncbi:hypothetical protein C809_04523 [Lachnospiraceae bacterium MD335]|nr:hypothetical protein C809_04523 [Lachnospiraceae bacterium MD335]
MNVNGIGTAGYPVAGYETRRTGRNYADQMCNMVPAAQASGGTFELHISNDKDGKAIGSMCGADYSLTVYQPKDFDPANPVYKVKVWDKSGNVTEGLLLNVTKAALVKVAHHVRRDAVQPRDLVYLELPCFQKAPAHRYQRGI